MTQTAILDNAPFVAGIELCRRYYQEAIQPILKTDFPDLPHAAALIGWGSEVLGFDTAMSRDHHWGPRAMLFLRESDLPRVEELKAVFSRKLPRMFLDYPTHYIEHAEEMGILHMAIPDADTPIRHRVEIFSLRDFIRMYLNYDLADGLMPSVVDWLTFTEQALRTVAHGARYHDDLGELTALQAAWAYFPHDVWLYKLAAGWARIGEEEPFVGRTGDVGDELGSQVLAARLVRDVMRLAFMMERQYAPYPKWFGTAFQQLQSAAALMPILRRVFAAETWRPREQALGEAYSILAALHNSLNLTPPLPTEPSNFHGRPYHVIHGARFAEALVEQIKDAEVKAIAAKTLIGGIDQWSDSTALLSYPKFRHMTQKLLE